MTILLDHGTAHCALMRQKVKFQITVFPCYIVNWSFLFLLCIDVEQKQKPSYLDTPGALRVGPHFGDIKRSNILAK